MFTTLWPLTLATLALLCIGAPGVAQTLPCVTNTGPAGQLIAGQFGTVTSTAAFDRVEVSDATLVVFADLRRGAEMLVLASAAAEAVTLTFYAEAKVVQACTVMSLPFDPVQHDLAALTVGDCAMVPQDTAPVLSGHIGIIQTPERYAEIAVSPRDIMDASPVTDRLIALNGLAPGLATLFWMRDGGGDTLGGVCPFSVKSAADHFAKAGLAKAALCHDSAGAPVRLQVGQSATLATHGKTHPSPALQAVRVGAAAIAQLSAVDEPGQTVVVTGISPGTTSIVMPHPLGQTVQTCVVVVE